MLVHLLPAMENGAILLSQNQIPEPNRHVFIFLYPTFCVQGHILSTAGDSLSCLSLLILLWRKDTKCGKSTLRATLDEGPRSRDQ